MKNSLNINLAGTVFTIDDDAYALLQSYLESLKQYYQATEEGKEIIADIEARLSEIFQEQLSDYYKVVRLQEVKAALAQMGSPEEIFEFDLEPEEQVHRKQKNRKLYRDIEQRYLAGVAAGVAHFLGFPPLYVRIVFLILHTFWGLGIIVYLILWFTVDEAKSSAQKLEMKGEKVNLTNIEKTIRDEFAQVQQKVERKFEEQFKKVSMADYARKTGSVVRKIFEGIGVLIRGLWLLVSALVGVSMVIVNTLLFTALVLTLIFLNIPINIPAPEIQTLQNLVSLVIPTTNLPLVSLGLAILVGIPLISFVYFGLRIAFRVQPPHVAISITLALLWIGGFFVTGDTVRKTITNFNVDKTVQTTTHITTPKPLRIELIGFAQLKQLQETDFEFARIKVTQENNAIYGLPKFTIKQSEDNKVHLKIEKRARGKNSTMASEHAKQINYHWEQTDSIIQLDHIFQVNDTIQRWYEQKVQITLQLPVGKRVHLSKGVRPILYDINNKQHIWSKKMAGKEWEMTSKGLSLYDTPNGQNN